MEITVPAIKISSLYPEIVIALAAFVIAILAFLKINLSSRVTGIISLAGIIVAGFLIFLIPPGPAGGEAYLNDIAAPFLKLAFLVAAFCAVALLTFSNSDEKTKSPVTFAALLLSLLGMMFLTMSSSLLSVFVSFELSAIPLILMVHNLTANDKNDNSAVKFIIVTATSSFLILYGFSFLYGLSGALNLMIMKLQIAIVHITYRQIGVAVFLAIVAVLTGMLFRSGLIPFNIWMRQLHEKLPVSISSFFGTAFLIMVVIFFAKVYINGLFAFYGPEMNPNDWGRFVGFVAFVNLIFGSIQFFRQKDLMRLIFYSNITQIGFILTGLITMNAAGQQATGYYLYAFLLATLGAYVITQIIQSSLGSTSLDSIKGLSKSSNVTAFLFSIFFLSMAGLPLLCGFVAKYSIIESALSRAAIDRTYHWIYLIAGAAGFAAIATLTKVIRMVVMIFSKNDFVLPPVKIPAGVYVLAALLVTAIVVFGIYPDPLLSFANRLPEAFGFITE